MAGNSFGRILRLTTFGESHGIAIGGILDGCPAGLPIDEAEIQADLDLRKPGQSSTSTRRKESDRLNILSGVFAGLSTGTPIAFYIANEDQRSRDYGNLAQLFRPGHADWTYFCKYRGLRDYRGGGRSSGRETAARVAAGAIAKKILSCACGARVEAACIELGGISMGEEEIDTCKARTRPYFAASDKMPPLWDEAVAKARAAGDSLGGIVQIVAKNVPAGLGEPVFDKLDAILAQAVLSVGAVKGVEFGSGFSGARSGGKENNDELFPSEKKQGHRPGPHFSSNNAGGILGGISTGQEIVFRVAVKPIASLGIEQNTIDEQGNAVLVRTGGRHDLSAIPRIVPVLTAMTALTLADALLLQRRMDVIP